MSPPPSPRRAARRAHGLCVAFCQRKAIPRAFMPPWRVAACTMPAPQGQMRAFVVVLPLRAPPRPRPGAERAPPPAVPCRPLFFHPLPAYGQRLAAPSAHLIPLEKCSAWMLIPLEKCSAGMLIPLEKCSEGRIIPLEKCIFVPEIPENVMLKRKIEQALLKWKQTAGRKPLVIKGIRQCGKTFIVQQFAREHYEHVVYVNFILTPVF